MEWITDSQTWLSLVTLTALEVVLGIDNIIFISILATKLPSQQQAKARTLGLALAMLTRIGLLLSIAFLMRLTQPLFSPLGNDISGRDIILILGGLFLLGKSTMEIHEKIEGDAKRPKTKAAGTLLAVIIQIALLDIVFSLDSVITAIGMASRVGVMIAAIVIAVLVMMVSSGAVSRFIEHHPTLKMLALSFLLLIGVALVGEGLDMHIPRGYIYFAMAFSVFVEVLNMKVRLRSRAAARD